MELETLQRIGNESRIYGTSSGAEAGSGYVEVKVGGGDWQQATDFSSGGDWATWDVKLNPHTESGNSTIYSRLVINEESEMSPVDSYRVILIDAQSDTGSSSSDGIMFGALCNNHNTNSNDSILGISLKDLRSRNN